MLTKERAKSEGPVLLRPFAKRELEVLDLLLAGMTSKEVAYTLDLSVRTVDGTVARLCEKAGVWRRQDLVVFAARSESRAA